MTDDQTANADLVAKLDALAGDFRGYAEIGRGIFTSAECSEIAEMLTAARAELLAGREVAEEAESFRRFCDDHGDFRNGVTDGDRHHLDEGNVWYSEARKPLMKSLAIWRAVRGS